MKKYTVIAKVISTAYKCTSYYGNPSYWVTFQEADGAIIEGYTATNAACGYGCTNYEGKTAEITYHITRGGSVIIDYIHKATI